MPVDEAQTLLKTVDQMEIYFRIAMNDPDEDLASQNTASEMTLWAVSVREVLEGLVTDLPGIENDVIAQEPFLNALQIIRRQVEEVAAIFKAMQVDTKVFAEVIP